MLSDAKLRKINGKPQEAAELPDAGGLSVRVSPKGKITFQFRYRFNGKPVRLKIGEYGVMSLADARAEVVKCKAILSKGNDPAVAIKQNIIKNATKATINDVVNDYLAMTQVRSLTSYESIEGALRMHITKPFGDLIVDDMTAAAWFKVFDRITAGGSPVQAGAVLSRMKRIINIAVRRGRIERDTIAGLTISDVGQHSKAGQRHLSDNEIHALWAYLDGGRMAHNMKVFVKLLLLTGCRSGELRQAKRSDFDFKSKVWQIPQHNSKTRIAFSRGISDDAISLIKSLNVKDGWLFPSNSGDGDPVHKSTIVQLVRRIGLRMGGDPFSAHDLRRTARTQLARLGIAQHVAEKVLGHTTKGVIGVYDKYDYLPEQIEAVNRLAGHIKELINNSDL